MVFQGEGWPVQPVDYNNPLPVAMFEVTTVGANRGTLEFFLRAPSSMPVPYLVWLDYHEDLVIATADQGTGDVDLLAGLTTSPISVRVIPAPAGVVILVLGELVRGGRRRRSSRHDPQEVSLVDGSLPFDRACFNRCRPMR